MKHSVYIFMQRILTHLKAFNPGIEMINIFSDGPISQFKQRFLFSNLHGWETENDLKIRWNFLATSHSKRVVDGIGGTLKSYSTCVCILMSWALKKVSSRSCLIQERWPWKFSTCSQLHPGKSVVVQLHDFCHTTENSSSSEGSTEQDRMILKIKSEFKHG